MLIKHLSSGVITKYRVIVYNKNICQILFNNKKYYNSVRSNLKLPKNNIPI